MAEEEEEEDRGSCGEVSRKGRALPVSVCMSCVLVCAYSCETTGPSQCAPLPPLDSCEQCGLLLH